MKLPWIDKNVCIGCGRCADLCPDGFEMVQGKSDLKDPNASCLPQAVSECPVGAIKLDSEKEAGEQTLLPFRQGMIGEGRVMVRGRGAGRGSPHGRGCGKGKGGRRR